MAKESHVVTLQVDVGARFEGHGAGAAVPQLRPVARASLARDPVGLQQPSRVARAHRLVAQLFTRLVTRVGFLGQNRDCCRN